MKNLFKKMILLLAVSMAVTLFSSAEPCPKEDPPGHTVLIADPSDCTAFFVCVNGVPIKMHCPDGLHFSDKLKVCEWPKNAECEKTGGEAKPHFYSCTTEILVSEDGKTVAFIDMRERGTMCDGSSTASCTPNHPCP